MPDNFIFMAFYFVLSKCMSFFAPLSVEITHFSSVYANSFLATLDTRRVLRGRGTDAETATMPTFLMVGKLTKHNQNGDHVYPPSEATSPSKHRFTRSHQSAMEIGIEQEVTVTRDSVSSDYLLCSQASYVN